MCERPGASSIKPLGPEAIRQAQNPLRGAQPLADAVGEQFLDECCAVGTDPGGTRKTPTPVAGKEGLRVRRQMIRHGEPRPGTTGPHVDGHAAVILVDRDRGVGGAQPQLLADQRKRHRIKRALILHMAVAVHGDTAPVAEVRRDGWQGL